MSIKSIYEIAEDRKKKQTINKTNCILTFIIIILIYIYMKYKLNLLVK